MHSPLQLRDKVSWLRQLCEFAKQSELRHFWHDGKGCGDGVCCSLQLSGKDEFRHCFYAAVADYARMTLCVCMRAENISEPQAAASGSPMASSMQLRDTTAGSVDPGGAPSVSATGLRASSSTDAEAGGLDLAEGGGLAWSGDLDLHDDLASPSLSGGTHLVSVTHLLCPEGEPLIQPSLQSHALCPVLEASPCESSTETRVRACLSLENN